MGNHSVKKRRVRDCCTKDGQRGSAEIQGDLGLTLSSVLVGG